MSQYLCPKYREQSLWWIIDVTIGPLERESIEMYISRVELMGLFVTTDQG